MAADSFNQSAIKMADHYRTPQELGDSDLHQGPIRVDAGADASAEQNETSIEARGRGYLQASPKEKAKVRKAIHKAILTNGYTIEQVIHVFNVERQYAQQLYYKAHAEATIDDFKDWDADFVREFKRAARLKLMTEGLYSDDPKMKRLALQAIVSMPDEVPDPNLIEMQPEGTPQSKHWERVQRIGGDVSYDDILEKPNEPAG